MPSCHESDRGDTALVENYDNNRRDDTNLTASPGYVPLYSTCNCHCHTCCLTSTRWRIIMLKILELKYISYGISYKDKDVMFGDFS